FIDGNLGLEYRYSNNLTAFINANNLLGNNYNLWEGYQSQAFNILGGFTYKF
ncbi:MAG: outer membrane receptor protein involved in Fe transport, partial [Flavobacteriales bacterium]